MARKKKQVKVPTTFLGMPMRWERDKVLKNIWNQNDDRIFPPKYFGIGWDINFHALLMKARPQRKARTSTKGE